MRDVNTHKLSNTDSWREAALHFKEFGCYTKLTPNPSPNSPYMKFWREEIRRSIHGLHTGSDYIPGYFYFYLNYSPIMIAEAVEDETEEERKAKLEDDFAMDLVRADRIQDFPAVWDGDYDYFHYLEEAEARGEWAAVLKTRGRGYSFKGASMLNRNYHLIPRSISYAIASEKEYLIRDGILSKAWANMSFLDQHTPWKKLRQVKKDMMHRRASYIANGIEKGYMSEIIGITMKDEPEKARGKRGKLILWEEAGKFSNLLKAWQIAKSSMKQGRNVYGLMAAFGTGGCLTAGNKVWNNEGELLNIEDIEKNIQKGIIGFDAETGFSKENITYWQKPLYKECIRIETNTRRWIECSLDHPIYKRIRSNKGGVTLGNEFIEAKLLNIGDDIGVIDNINIWSDQRLEHSRTIGWLIGDGTYGNNQSVRIANCEEEITKYLENNYNCKTQVEYITKLGKTYKELRIKDFCKVLRENKIFGQTRDKKTLPHNIHSYSKESVCELIGGLFDTDGYVSIRDNKERINSKICEISIAQSHIKILLELQLLLQKLGVHSSIRTKKARLDKKSKIKDVNDWYELCIRDKKSLISFCENIILFPKEKQKRLNQILKYVKTIKTGREYNNLRYEKITKIERTGVKRVYNLTASNTHTYIGNGIITHNTEGAEFESLEKLFYKPKAYNIYAISNRWDADRAGTLSGYYHGEQTNREGFMDKNGNSDEEAAANQVRKERKIMEDEGIGRTEMLQEIAENSLSPAEAVLRTTGVYFPIADLKTHLATIESQPRKYIYSNYTGYLTFDVETDIIKWNNDDTYKPIRDFPLPKLEPGCIEIYEMPQMNSNRVIEFGRYIAGCDPIDRQKTTYTESLGSMFVFDRWTRRIVAEYTGRPENPKTFYENCRRLAMFYNCTILYENNLTGMFTYFEQKKSLHLLADTPANIRDNNNFTEGTNTSKGVPGSTNLNMKAREYSKSWLLDNIPGGNILCLQTIRSVALLKELIAWSHDGNFDRVSALGMTLFYDNCLYREDSEEQGMNKKSLIEQDEYWKGWGLFEDEPNIAYDDSGSLIPLPNQRIYNDVQEQPFEFGM